MYFGILNPWVFMALYVGLWIAGSMVNVLSIVYWLSCAAGLLHLWWAWSAARFLANYASPPYLRAKNYFTTINYLIAAALVAAVTLILLLANNKATALSAIGFFLGMGIAGLLLAILWTASTSLCEVEAGKPQSVVSVVGTFVCFVYLVIGVPFLFRRLHRLAAGT